MSKPLLSICIPTYNRSKYLKQSIESIICQEEFLSGKVEIVISDNASQDDTAAVIKAFTDKFDNIYFYHNEINIRDQNFPLALSRGHGLLRRLCNDTLIFAPGSLGEMCRIIESNIDTRPFICWANGEAINKQKILQTDFRGYIRDLSYQITSIACFSLWDEECNDIQNDIDGCELSLWQVRKGFEIASKKNVVVVCNSCYTQTLQVAKKNVSYGLYKVFYENYFSLIKPYVTGNFLTFDDFEFLEKDILFRFFAIWCAKWELNDDNLQYSKTEDLKKSIWDQYKGKSYWNRFCVFYCYKLLVTKVKNIGKRLLKK